MSKMPTLPKTLPLGREVVSYAAMRDQIKGKFVPREPRDGELLLRLKRPQIGPYEFAEYARGDGLLSMSDDHSYVIVAAKPGFSRSGEGWKRCEQLVVVRPATDEEHAYLAAAQRERIASQGPLFQN